MKKKLRFTRKKLFYFITMILLIWSLMTILFTVKESLTIFSWKKVGYGSIPKEEVMKIEESFQDGSMDVYLHMRWLDAILKASIVFFMMLSLLRARKNYPPMKYYYYTSFIDGILMMIFTIRTFPGMIIGLANWFLFTWLGLMGIYIGYLEEYK